MRVSGVSRIHAEKKGNFLLLPLKKKKIYEKAKPEEKGRAARHVGFNKKSS